MSKDGIFLGYYYRHWIDIPVTCGFAFALGIGLGFNVYAYLVNLGYL